ncbi:EVE domain-containing protein [Marinobacteraceae bacterium S3BR75-40.1]
MSDWLVKTEPDECSIDDLARDPQKPMPWDGVRNYQARNFLREMSRGDRVFIYHASCKRIGIAGLARVVREAYPDPSQFDTASPYCDPRSKPDNPRWSAVDLVFEQKFDRILPLQQLREEPGLADLALVRRGNRLSVMPVTADHYQIIMRMASS